MKKTALTLASTLILLTSLTVGCGQQTAQVQQNNSNPVGSITGIIYVEDTNAPLSGARAYVLVNGGYQIATANQQGVYTLSNLPLGSVYTITYTAVGYATPIYNVDLSGVNTSQFPQGNAVIQSNAGMYPLTAKVTGTISNGMGSNTCNVGLQGAAVVVDFRNIGNGNPFVGFEYRVSTTTDASGNYTLSNLPASMFGTFNGFRPFVFAYYVDSNNVYHQSNSGFVSLFPNATTVGIDTCIN